MAAVKPGLRDLMRELAAGQRDWPLYLWGATGVGKTSAALALADFCFTVYHRLDKLSTLTMKHEADWDEIGWADLAILDEIGMRRATDLTYSVLLEFWETRQQRDQRTIYISNLSPADLASNFDGRVESRLLFGTVAELTDNDRRMEAAQQ
jgi:chromosomal replication initiation ATPase DnaA